jgi:peroxiredoxin Q/BCP
MNRVLAAAVLAVLGAANLAGIARAEVANGAAAPPFRLQDQDGKWVSLADQRGKWVVLYFYPMDDTPGCTTEACEFRDNIFAFRRLGVSVLGVSVQDVASKKAFATKHGLPFPLLADTDKAVAQAYGVLAPMGVARRETFVIDPQGNVARHYASVDPKTHSKQLLADLSAMVKPGAAAP